MEPAAGRQGATASTAGGLLFGDLPQWSPPLNGGSTPNFLDTYGYFMEPQ
ncbi:MAG: hypothetical protein ACLQFR_06160 [Streptosporangiaceae bacterium]